MPAIVVQDDDEGLADLGGSLPPLNPPEADGGGWAQDGAWQDGAPGELPPWADAQGPDGLPAEARDECEFMTAPMRKQGAFLPKNGQVTRQQIIEYVNLQRWSREGCSTFTFSSLLWMLFLLLADIHSHINVSFQVYKEVTEALDQLVAKEFRGIAPNAIFSAAGTSMCACSCPAMCGQQIQGGEWLPGVPVNASLFNGTVLPEQLQTMRAKAHYLRNVGKKERTGTLKNVHKIDDVWFWLQHGLVPELWHEEPGRVPLNTTMIFATDSLLSSVKGKLDANEKPGHFMRWNQVIGGVRLRQRRLNTEGCRADKRVADAFKQKCHNKHTSVMPFGPGKKAYAEGFVPNPKERGAFDVYLDTGRPVHIALETLQFMLHGHHWLDGSTSSLEVHVPMVNLEATPALYGLLEIKFEFTRSGSLTKKVNLWTAAANPYPGFGWTYLIDIAWLCLIGYLFVKKQFQTIRYFIKIRERHDVLCNFWFMFDWALLVFGSCIIGSWVYLVQETGKIGDAIVALPPAPPFDAQSELIKTHHDKWSEVLDNIQWLTVWRERLRMAQFGYTMVLIFQFIKAFRGQPKLAQLTRTLINAAEDLVHFIACFVTLFLSFAFSGHLVFGVRLEEWSTSTKCVNAAFRALRGDISLPQMYEVAPVTTIVWFWMFLVSMIFILMNLLLGMIYDHYKLVKAKANAFTGILTQAKDALRDVWFREGFKMLFGRCLCRCRRRDDFPPHPDMLEELTTFAGYSVAEKHHVFRTVLGPKWMRKKTEKHVFAGELPAEHIKLDEMEPAEADLRQMGLDQDYMFKLLEDAANYREREFDAEEVHVGQMRELVTLAEIEMAAMRKRLGECQSHMRFTMHDLARRLESLERAVHCTLGDLVFLAGAAGVPEKTEKQPIADNMESLEVNHPYAASMRNLQLTNIDSRVMSHLAQGTLKKIKDEREKKQETLRTHFRFKQQNNTYARIHTNARLAHAFGEEDRKRVARDHAMV